MKEIQLGILLLACAIIMASAMVYEKTSFKNQLEQKEIEIQQLADKVSILEDLLYCEGEAITINSKDANISEDVYSVWIYIGDIKFKNDNFKIFQDGQETEFKGGGLNGRYIEVPILYADKDTLLEVRYLCECPQCEGESK